MPHPDAILAATRFGLGPRPGELEAIGDDPRGWLLEQLKEPEPTPLLDALPHSTQIVREFADRRSLDEAGKRALRERQRSQYHQAAVAWMQTAAASTQPFRERLVALFTNHFTVSIARPEVVPLVGPFMVEAIRPHITGRFSDMLLASTRHPAMLVYLDNVRSIGPDSRAGKRSGRGLNENLAREVLELHTLGVDGGYTQADVESFAAMLTGWGVCLDGSGSFYEPRRHQPGDKTLLGKRYAGSGQMEAVLALSDLARHPRTARFLATKIARHFVADQPPVALIDTLTREMLDTDGDLHAVAARLVQLDAAWEVPYDKLRTPLDLTLAGARAFGWEEDGPAMVSSLQMLGQAPHSAASPEGWPDTAEEWLGPDALLSRLEWAQLLASQSLHRVPDPGQRVEQILGSSLSPTTRRALARSADPTEMLALMIASPEFQRR